MSEAKRQLVMRLDELKHPDKNVRKHPRKQIDEFKRSIEKFGQFRPIVVDEENIIRCGNGLVIAMKEMGIEQGEVIKYENLTEADKKRLMIADNQIASLGVDDYGAIEEFIKEIKFDIPGYDDDTLQMIVDESEHAVEQAMSYGVYQQDEVQRMRDIEQRREEEGIQPVAPVYTAPPSDQYMQQPYAPTVPVNETEYEVAETKKFVLCPHCGEKIYI